ncbi:MAG: hypothetical protein JSW07_09730, partial [bacterium]
CHGKTSFDFFSNQLIYKLIKGVLPLFLLKIQARAKAADMKQIIYVFTSIILIIVDALAVPITFLPETPFELNSPNTITFLAELTSITEAHTTYETEVFWEGSFDDVITRAQIANFDLMIIYILGFDKPIEFYTPKVDLNPIFVQRNNITIKDTLFTLKKSLRKDEVGVLDVVISLFIGLVLGYLALFIVYLLRNYHYQSQVNILFFSLKMALRRFSTFITAFVLVHLLLCIIILIFDMTFDILSSFFKSGSSETIESHWFHGFILLHFVHTVSLILSFTISLVVTTSFKRRFIRKRSK